MKARQWLTISFSTRSLATGSNPSGKSYSNFWIFWNIWNSCL